MSASTQTAALTIESAQARIHYLPGRPPFMLASDLAEIYGTRPKDVTGAVKRNPTRFPADFIFTLTEAETEHLKTQNASSNFSNRALPKAFTEQGAYALCGVLKTERAAEVSVVVFRAFAAMQKALRAELVFSLQKFREEVISRKPLWVRMRSWIRDGWTFDQIRQELKSRSLREIEQAIADMLRLGLIDAPPAGTPYSSAQLDLFREV